MGCGLSRHRAAMGGGPDSSERENNETDAALQAGPLGDTCSDPHSEVKGSKDAADIIPGGRGALHDNGPSDTLAGSHTHERWLCPWRSIEPREIPQRGRQIAW